MAWSPHSFNPLGRDKHEMYLAGIKAQFNATAPVPILPVRDPEREHENDIFCNGQFKHLGRRAQLYRQRLVAILRTPGWRYHTKENDEQLAQLVVSNASQHSCGFCSKASAIKEEIIECIREHIDHRPT